MAMAVLNVRSGTNRLIQGTTHMLADVGTGVQCRLAQNHVRVRLGLPTKAAGKQFFAMANGAHLRVSDRAQGCASSARAVSLHGAVATGSGAANTGKCCHHTGCRLGGEAAVSAIACRVGC